MSTTPPNRSPKVKKKPALAGVDAVKPGRSKSISKKTSGETTGSARTKPIRRCAACEAKVSLSARYCRHCGKALSAEVPANPFLPPPPKPWRPSRIPKQRPTPVLPEVTLQVPPKPVETGPDQAVVVTPKDVPDPIAPRVWDPVPEVEQRMAQLRALHDRLRPQLARAELFKRRLRLP